MAKKPPLFDLAHFQTLVAQGDWGYLNLTRPNNTKDKYGWDDDDVFAVLRGLTCKDFRKSEAACRVHELPGVHTVPVDHYRIHWDMRRNKRSSDPIFGTTEPLFLKITIVDESPGHYAGLVTLHTSGMQ